MAQKVYKDKKQYTPAKNNKNEINDSKKDLMNKFVSRTKKTTSEGNVVDDKITTPEPVNNTPKNDTKHVEEIQKLKKQIVIEKEKRSKLSEANKKLEDKLRKQTSLYNDVKNAYESLQSENKSLLDKLTKIPILESELYEFKERDEYNNRLIQSLKDKYEAAQDKVNELEDPERESSYINTINQLKESNKDRKYIIDGLNGKILDLQFDIKLIKARLKISDISSDKITVSDEVNILKSISKNIKSSFRKFKFGIYNDIKSAKNRYKYRVGMKKNDKKTGAIVHGTICKSRFFGYKFKTIDDKVYNIFWDSLKKKNFNVGMVGTAVISKKYNKAWIKYIHFDDDNYLRDFSKSKKKITKKTKVKVNKEKVDNVPDLDLKVLIITALNTKKYTESLREVGIKANYFNSYYENAKRLDKILSKYDMVFYCIGHSKHYCKDVIKKQSDSDNKDKYYTLSDDSVNNILSIIDNRVNSMMSYKGDEETDVENEFSDNE